MGTRTRKKVRFEKDYLPRLQRKDIDSDLIKETFDKRFKEIEL